LFSEGVNKGIVPCRTPETAAHPIREWIFIGKTCTASFTARVDNPGTINAAFQRDGGGFASYGSQTFALTGEAKNYLFSFTMSGATEPSVRFVIEMGKLTGTLIFDDYVVTVD
jgi:hypothetical protein